MAESEGISVARCSRYLGEHPDATAIDLADEGLAPQSLLAPERLLRNPVDPARMDLVAEFRRSPLGPHSEELVHLLWNLRAQTPNGRYVLERVGRDRWRALHLIGGRRPRREQVPEPPYETREDAEWAIFRLRWRDHTGIALPIGRGER